MKRSNPIAVLLTNQSPVGGLGKGSRTHGFTFHVYQDERKVLTMRLHISKTSGDPSLAAKELRARVEKLAAADPWSVLLEAIEKECRESDAQSPSIDIDWEIEG